MRGVSRPYSVFVHFSLRRKMVFSDLRSGNKVMGIIEEGKNIIWMRKICGELREGHFCFGCGNVRVFSSGNPQKWGAENVELSEDTILGDIPEDAERMGMRKASAPSYREVRTANEIQQILKYGYKVITNFNIRSSLISENVVFMVMEREKNVKLVFRFFLWVVRKSCFKRNQDLVTLMSDILEQSKEFDTAWDVLREMKRRGVQNGFDAAPFTALIRAYAKAGLLEKAVETFSLMEEFSCKPNILTWNAIFDIFVREEMIEIAMALYHQMLKIGCRPSFVTFNVLIRGLCNAGKLEDARDLFDQMHKMGFTPTFRSCAIILKSHCIANNMDEAFRLFDLMKEKFCSLDIMIYNIIINGLCKIGQIDHAFEFLHELKDENIAPNKYTYSSLLHGLFKAGRFDEGCKYFRDLLKDQITPELVLCTVMIDAFCDAGRINDAFQVLSTMRRNRCSPDAFCYNTLIKGLCNVGLFDKACSLKLEMSQKGFLNIVTYNTLICGFCDEGLLEEAHDMFDEMTNNGYVPDVFICNKLIGALCKACDDRHLQKACVLLCKMEMGNDPSLFLSIAQGSNPANDGADLQALVDGRCSIGRVLEIYKLSKRLMESGPVPNVITYNVLIDGLCKAGKIDKAIKLFEAMHLKGYIPNVITYNTLIDGLCRVNRKKDAFTLFEQMARKGCSPDVVTYRTLMTSLCQTGNKIEISQALNLWVNYISQRYTINYQKSSRIHILFDEGNIEEAFRTVVQIDTQQNSSDSGAYSILIIGLCKVGRLDAALTLYDIIQENNLDITAPAYALLIFGLYGADDVLKSLELFGKSLKKGILLHPHVGDILQGDFVFKEEMLK